jgi:endonuclease I
VKAKNSSGVRYLLSILMAVTALATDVELRARLHEQLRTGAKVIPHSSSSRFDTSDALAIIDALPGDTNTVRLIYSTATHPASTFGNAGGWNREHLWPNSYGLDDVEPAFSDLHNLRACDSNVNSARGNKLFDMSSAADGNLRNPAHSEAPLCTTDANSWQPPADQRGDIARALFYMDVRYEGDVVGEPDLELIQDIERINSNASFMGRLSTLLLWNEQDPPDDSERARDAAVKAIQGNTNPFVAAPTLANRLWLPKVTVARSGEGVVLGVEPTDLPVALEFATNLTGPWTTNAPQTDPAPATFARVRLLP